MNGVNERLLRDIYTTLSDPRYKNTLGQAPAYETWKSNFVTSENLQGTVFNVLKQIKGDSPVDFMQ